MAKNIFRRCLLGAPTGLMIFTFIALFFAYLSGDGELRVGYYLVRVYGSEVNALTALVLSSMAIGMVWSAASVIFDTDWNLLSQTVLHGICCVIPSVAIAWGVYWIPHTLDGLVQYVAIFAVIYVLVWILQYLSIRRRLRQFNTKIGELEEN